MSLWSRVFASVYDRSLAASEEAGLATQRNRLLEAAHGRVLEIGAGTGLNLPHYRDAVTELVLFEPAAPMARKLREKLAAPGTPPATVVTELDFPADRFETVVSTLVLCTVPDPAATLREIDRLLVPGGRLLFLEHVRADEPKLARWQDRLAPLWKPIGEGCHCNRDTAATLRASPLAVERADPWRLPKAAPIVRPAIVGSAVSAA